MKFLNRPILLFFLFFSPSLLSGTNYTFSGPGNWEDVSLWTPSYPGTNIGYNDILSIQAGSDCSISTTINNYGIIFFYGEIHNSGEIKNYPDAKIFNRNVIDNYGIINNDGNIHSLNIINNYGDFANFSNFRNTGNTFNRCGGNYFGNVPTENPIITVPPDADGDHFVSTDCGGTDCDDNDPSVHPGAPELCDGIDNDCNPNTPDGYDEVWYGDPCDGPDSDYCFEGVKTCSGGIQQCDDNSSDDIEICDGIDNDCDGQVDEGLSFDNDLDRHYSISSCLAPNDDCDDNDPTIYPGAPEICDGKDNDCNGQTDEGLDLSFYPDNDRDGYGNHNASPVLSCFNIPFYVLNNDDCNDNNSAVHPGNTEVCDGIDNDCNGLIDEGVLLSFYPDNDQDGFGDALSTPIISCLNIPFHVLNNDDCNDGDPAIKPAATEVCDGIDNDCDGSIDGGLQLFAFYPDNDRDGLGDAFATPIVSCLNIPFHVLNDYDCNDNDPRLLGAGTRCDDNNILTINDVWDEHCNCSGTLGNFHLLKYCPVDMTLQALPGMDYAKVHYPLPGGFSNCPDPAVKLALIQGYDSGYGFPIGTTTVNYLLFDACENKEYCEFDITVETYVPPCQISASLGGFSCNDNNTPRDPSDDTYFYHVTVFNNAGCGVNWSSDKGTWLYNIPQQFGPFFISDGPHTIAIWDEINPGIRQTINVTPPPPCGDLDNDGIIDQACANRGLRPISSGLCGDNFNLDGLDIITGLTQCDSKFAFYDGTFDEFYDGTALLKGTLINTQDDKLRFKVDLLFSGTVQNRDTVKDTLVFPPVNTFIEYSYKHVYGKLTGDKKAVPGRFRVNLSGPVLHIGHKGNKLYLFGELDFKVERQAWGVQLQDKKRVPIYGELSGDPFVCVPLPNNQTGNRSNLSFIAYENDIEEVELNWRFSNPDLISDCWIERSFDGTNFSELDIETTQETAWLYRTFDTSPKPGPNFYRLKILSKTGFIWYSEIERVEIIEIESVRIFPNPVQDEINIIYQAQPKSMVRLQIANTLGKVVKEFPDIHFSGRHHSIEISDLPPGTYYLWIFESGKRPVGKIVVVDNGN